MNSAGIDPKGWEIEESFDSKKNEVFKVKIDEEHYVVKKYSPEFKDSMNVEKDILKSCYRKGLKVPKVVDYSDERLILEYIEGRNCKALYDESEKEDVRNSVLTEIAGWLSRFHSKFDFQKRRGDSILSNFILSESGVYGIDFEEADDRDPLRDVGDMIVSIIRLRPAFTEERFFQTRFFINEYFSKVSIERKDLTEQVAESLLHYSKYSSMGESMRGWAEKIQRDGLSDILQN